MSASKPWCWIAGIGAVLSCQAQDQVLVPDAVDGGKGGQAGASATGGGGANPMTGGTSGSGGSGVGATGGSGGAGGLGTGGAAGVGTGGSTNGGAAGATHGGAAGASTGGAGVNDAGLEGGAGTTTGGSDAARDGSDDGARPPTALDPDCDLNGIWIAQQISVATALSAPQYGNVWNYLELRHDGADFVVTRQFDCGGEVKGTLRVTLREATTRVLMTHNRQTGRRGTMRKNAGGTCELAFERFWGVRGAVEANFIPAAGRNSSADMTQVQAERPLPRPAAPMGAEDWDMDTYQGIGWDVSGAATGRRHSVQRDWTRWFTDSSYPIVPAFDWTGDIMARAEVDLEDSVFATEPAGNFLLAAGAVSDIRNANNRVILRFLGRTMADPRVAALPIAGTDPDGNPTAALATCSAIQAALPAKQAR
jgi:hypothetical protein